MKNLELIEKTLKKNSTQQLFSKLGKLNQVNQEYEVILSILKARGQDVSNWENSKSEESEVVYEDTEGMTEEDLKVVEQVEEKEPSLRDKLIEEVDQFMDELIAQKRTGVNLQVLKSLGGQYGSDLDVLLENASIEQLNEALSFKGLKPKQEVSKVDSLIAKGKELKNKEPKKENQTPAVSKSSKSIPLEESEEVKGLVAGSSIKFLPNKRLNITEEVIGVVLSVYKCHKNNFKEFCKIKFNGKILYKRSNSVKLIEK